MHYWSIHLQIQMKSPRFFPTLKARCLKQDVDEKSIQLERVEKNIKMIMDRFENEVSTPVNLLFLFVALVIA